MSHLPRAAAGLVHLLALWTLGGCGGHGGPPLTPVPELYRAEVSELAEPGVWIVRDAAGWDEWWRRIAPAPEGAPQQPEADFGRDALVVAAAGAGSAGAPAVGFEGYRMRGDTLIVVARWMHPGAGCPVADLSTRAAVVGRVPRPAGPVLLIRRRSTRPC